MSQPMLAAAMEVISSVGGGGATPQHSQPTQKGAIGGRHTLRVVVGRDLDNVRADDLEALQCLEDLLDLLRDGHVGEHAEQTT